MVEIRQTRLDKVGLSAEHERRVDSLSRLNAASFETSYPVRVSPVGAWPVVDDRPGRAMTRSVRFTRRTATWMLCHSSGVLPIRRLRAGKEAFMPRLPLLSAAAMLAALAAAPAAAQSSNTSSNSSSNNGVVRERIVDSYCDGGYCERRVVRRTFRDDRRWRRYRDDDRRRYRDRWDDDDD